MKFLPDLHFDMENTIMKSFLRYVQIEYALQLTLRFYRGAHVRLKIAYIGDRRSPNQPDGIRWKFFPKDYYLSTTCPHDQNFGTLNFDLEMAILK